MARKMGFYGILAYIVFGFLAYWYLFYLADTSLPFEFQGSRADPATFLNPREYMLSEEYSKIRNLLFFLSTPYEWLFYFLVLLVGLSGAFKKWGKDTFQHKLLQNGVYIFWLSLFSYAATFPLSYISYNFSKTYNISTQSFPSWMKDELIGFWVNFVTLLITISVLYWLIQRSRKYWWLLAWLLSIPFTLFIMFVQPVVIDPLYNDFSPLKNKELEAKILDLAGKADIPANHVFEVNMAEKTNALNAYVTGIGGNSRIVLWDTTLNRLSDGEILFIMAHEMAHYVEKHIYIGIAGYLILSLFGLWLTSRMMAWAIRRWGKELKVDDVGDIRSVPLLLMILSMLMFISSPASNFVSRYQETRADRYAIEMTGNTDDAIGSFQTLTKAGLSQVNPPLLVKIFRYGHPTMLERISRLEDYEVEQRNKNTD
ncbi:M48 family metallopeptidase [Mesobacillus zeae]|uniref:M48 family peptidase n=1 Tax=Mesobacillus zeae TaxID=1917180 RepID=A0A398B3P9_9BACI|nr:M48 family metallopeptidase [Mesobacillus zeae]RID84599.1 M48 family peptidase [Mesobacillus zeae]